MLALDYRPVPEQQMGGRMRKIQPAIRAYLQITLDIPEPKREGAITRVYLPNRPRFLERTEGAVAMDVLLRPEDAQLLIGFDTLDHAKAYRDGSSGQEILAQFSEFTAGTPAVALYTVD